MSKKKELFKSILSNTIIAVIATLFFYLVNVNGFKDISLINVIIADIIFIALYTILDFTFWKKLNKRLERKVKERNDG
jgi:uncharacterized membrane protein YkvI